MFRFHDLSISFDQQSIFDFFCIAVFEVTHREKNRSSISSRTIATTRFQSSVMSWLQERRQTSSLRGEKATKKSMRGEGARTSIKDRVFF